MSKKTQILIISVAAALITMACACPLTNLINQFTNPDPETLLEMLPDEITDEFPEGVDEMLEEVITAVPEIVEENMGEIPEAIEENDMQELFNQGVPENIPMVEDYDDLISFGGVISYNTPMAFEKMVAFYEENMIENGWTKVTGTVDSGSNSAALNYENETQLAFITITVEDEKTVVSMVITDQ